MTQSETTSAAGGVAAEPSEAALHAAMDAFYPGEDWRTALGGALDTSLRDMRAALSAAALAAPTAKGGTERPKFSENDLRDLSERKGWYRREGTSVPTLDGWYHPFTVTADGRALCDFINEFAASPPPPAGAAAGDAPTGFAPYTPVTVRSGTVAGVAGGASSHLGALNAGATADPAPNAAASHATNFRTLSVGAPTPDLGAQGEPVARVFGSAISTNPMVCSGRPCLPGSRITIAQVLAEIAERGSLKDFADDFALDRTVISKAIEALAAHPMLAAAPAPPAGGGETQGWSNTESGR